MASYLNMMDIIKKNDPVKNCWENQNIPFSQAGGTATVSSQENAMFKGNELFQNDGKQIGTIRSVGSTAVVRFAMPNKK